MLNDESFNCDDVAKLLPPALSNVVDATDNIIQIDKNVKRLDRTKKAQEEEI